MHVYVSTNNNTVFFYFVSSTPQIGYNIFLSFLGNKKAPEEDVKSALVPMEGGKIERLVEDIEEDSKYGSHKVLFLGVVLVVY